MSPQIRLMSIAGGGLSFTAPATVVCVKRKLSLVADQFIIVRNIIMFLNGVQIVKACVVLNV